MSNMGEVHDGELIHREFPIELQPTGDGRTLDVRIVPFNKVARVSDGGEPYDEVWVPGAFDRQMNAANRVLVNFEHVPGLANVIGRGTELRDTGEALDGTFRVLEGDDGDKALELVREGVLTGVSLEAVPLRSERDENGVVKRIKARLVNIALCRFPAFAGAEVLAVRSGQTETTPQAPMTTFNFTFPNSNITWPVGTTGGTGAWPATATDVSVRVEPDEPDPEPDPVDEPEGEGAPDPERVEAALEMVGRRRFEDVLERVGYAPLVERAVTRRPWDGSASRFTDEQYQRSCLIDRGGDSPPKSRCSLPVLEPNGDVNANALSAAAAVLAGGRGGLANVTQAQKAAAARKLIRYYRQADMTPPPSLVSLAGR